MELARASDYVGLLAVGTCSLVTVAERLKICLADIRPITTFLHTGAGSSAISNDFKESSVGL